MTYLQSVVVVVVVTVVVVIIMVAVVVGMSIKLPIHPQPKGLSFLLGSSLNVDILLSWTNSFTIIGYRLRLTQPKQVTVGRGGV